MFQESFQPGQQQDHPGHPVERAVFQRVKDWIERRLSRRREASLPVLVLQGTQVQSGMLTDISVGGFGLSKISGLAADELISIATQDGRIFEGRVVWINGSRAGVSLISWS
jgi:hypothetical protein